MQPPLRRYLKHHPYPEDIFWLIEYSDSTLAKDLSEKKQLYAEAGIQEYWIADLKNSQLRVFRKVENRKWGLPNAINFERGNDFTIGLSGLGCGSSTVI